MDLDRAQGAWGARGARPAQSVSLSSLRSARSVRDGQPQPSSPRVPSGRGEPAPLTVSRLRDGLARVWSDRSWAPTPVWSAVTGRVVGHGGVQSARAARSQRTPPRRGSGGRTVGAALRIAAR